MAHFRSHSPIKLASSAMLLSLVLMFPPAAFAQTRAQTSIITQLLAQSLLRCYDAPADRIGAEDEVILRVELNTSGDILNLPEILSPPTLSIGERSLAAAGNGGDYRLHADCFWRRREIHLWAF
ncbi:MAG: hypothetical protein AAED33_05690 [Paracoccaceae bacterium]|jgi:hypothetical protein